MTSRSKCAWLSALGVTVGYAIAIPCSVDPSYRAPTHFERVKDSEVIVLAHAVEFVPSTGNPRWGRFRFELRAVLKGSFARRRFWLEGSPEFRGRTAEDDLDAARWGAFTGGCVARDYRVGHDYVLFGLPYGERLLVLGPPFTRINEEVDGPESPWTQAVSRLAEIARMGNADAEHAALEGLLDAAVRGEDPRRVPPQMELDLVRYLSFPSRHMPWPTLLRMHASAQDEEGRKAAIQAMAGCDFARHRQEVESFLLALEPAVWMAHAVPLSRLVARLRSGPCALRLLAGYSGEAQVARAICLAADPMDVPEILEKASGLPPEAGALLAPLLESHTSPAADRWRQEVIAALGEVVGERCCKKYWESVGLSALGDPRPVDWAGAVLDGKEPDGCCGLVYQILAWSPLPEARDHADRLVMERRQDELAGLVAAYDDCPRPLPWSRLREIVLLPARDPQIETRLRELFRVLVSEGHAEARDLLDVIERNRVSREAEISKDEERRAHAARARTQTIRWAATAICVSVLAVTAGVFVLLLRRRR